MQIESYNQEAEADQKELLAIEENPLESKDHMDELEVFSFSNLSSFLAQSLGKI
jgi:hypothetical protein